MNNNEKLLNIDELKIRNKRLKFKNVSILTALYNNIKLIYIYIKVLVDFVPLPQKTLFFKMRRGSHFAC